MVELWQARENRILAFEKGTGALELVSGKLQ